MQVDLPSNLSVTYLVKAKCFFLQAQSRKVGEQGWSEGLVVVVVVVVVVMD